MEDGGGGVRREIPADIPSEESLLGAVLISDRMLSEARHLLDPSDFLKPAHQQMWAAILELHEAGEAVDAVTVAAKSGIELADVARLVAETPSVSAWRTYANRIVDQARRRHLLRRLADFSSACYDTSDVDSVVAEIEAIGESHLIGSRHVEVKGLQTGVEFMARSVDRQQQHPWLIPGLIRQRWRLMIVGPEGAGKGTLFRQLALHASAGRDPFAPHERIPAVRTLYVDAENPETTIELQMRIANTMGGVDLVAESGDNYQLWHQDGGMDLRQPRDQAMFETVIRQVKPELVFIGPFYKVFSRKSSEDLEQTTIEILKFLDEMRTRYNFGLVIEHHLTKGQGTYRSKDPFGSSALKRWPEIGISMELLDGNDDGDMATYGLSRFRNDREPANWPTAITKNNPNSVVAWSGYWEHGR